MEVEGYQKILASELPRETQGKLRQTLRQELTEAMVESILKVPPTVDLSQVELVLRPGQQIEEWDAVKDCATCGTCGTSDGGCGTCGTQ